MATEYLYCDFFETQIRDIDFSENQNDGYVCEITLKSGLLFTGKFSFKETGFDLTIYQGKEDFARHIALLRAKEKIEIHLYMAERLIGRI